MVPFTREAAGRRRRRCVGVMGSQTGKTDGILNIPGQRTEDDPAPVLYVGPTKNNIEKVIEPRVMKMIRSVPSLHEQLDPRNSTKTLKQIAGISWRFAWAGSPTEVASQDAAITLTDELDRMKANVSGEGSPLPLIEGRLESHPDGVSVVTSTPTDGNVETYTDEFGLERWKLADPKDVASPIWRLWQEGTRHEWAWPCPECMEYFIPRLKYLWCGPKDVTPQQAKKEARLICPHCGSQIANESKDRMNARGVPVAPGERVRTDGIIEGRCEENDVYSLWVSGLCSSWRTFGQRAQLYVEALQSGDDNRIKAVVNTRFGELYRVGGSDGPQVESVKECKAQYVFGEVPEGVRDVTCYVDVQKRKFYYAIRGWGDSMESWLLEAGEIHGETEHDEVWDLLSEFRDRDFGDGLRIKRLGIDSGYRPGDKWRRPDNQIYSFCRRFRGWALPTKGYQKLQKPLSPSLIDVTLAGKTYKGGLQLWKLDSDYFKSWVHARLSWPESQPGRWHVPSDVTDDYCEQITAEARIVKPSGQVVWARLRNANHYLDCEAGNAAMAQVLGLHRRRAKKRQPRLTPEQQAQTPATQSEKKPPSESARPVIRNPFQRRDSRGFRR